MLSPEDMIEALGDPLFISYCIASTLIFLLLSHLSTKEIAKKYVYFDLGLVALFGAFTVLSTKALSSFMNSSFQSMFEYPITYILLVVLISTVVVPITI